MSVAVLFMTPWLANLIAMATAHVLLFRYQFGVSYNSPVAGRAVLDEMVHRADMHLTLHSPATRMFLKDGLKAANRAGVGIDSGWFDFNSFK